MRPGGGTADAEDLKSFEGDAEAMPPQGVTSSDSPPVEHMQKTGRKNAPAESPTDPDLEAVAMAWPTLPAALKAGILAMVKAAGGEGTP